MTINFTADGMNISTLTELTEKLSSDYRAIYGNDINLNPNTPDGQRVGLESKLISDIEESMLNLFNQMDVDLAIGEWLNKLIKLAGISRKPATRSTAEITVTTDRPLTLPVNYTVQDQLNQSWIVTTEVNLIAGANTVTFVAKDFGSISADANTIDTQSDIVLGVISVTNPQPAVAGLDEETDSELRIRRAQSVEKPAYSTVGGLFARLADLEGVVDVAILENDKAIYDAMRDILANTIWCVVEGGESAKIVETIAKNRTAGVNTKGSESGVYIEELIRPDGSTFEIQHEMNFDRPTVVDVYITLTATRVNITSPIDIDLIKQKLAGKVLRIQDNIRASQLYGVAYQAGTNFVLSDMLISDDNITFTDERLVSDFGAKFRILESNITINEVV